MGHLVKGEVGDIYNMRKEIPEAKTNELERLYQRATIIFNFISEKDNQKPKDNDFWGDKRERLTELWKMCIDNAYARNDIRG